MAVPPRSRGQAEERARRSFVAPPRRGPGPIVHPYGRAQRVRAGRRGGGGAGLGQLPLERELFRHPAQQDPARLGLALGRACSGSTKASSTGSTTCLMTFFFFVVGLEIKRELVEGELSQPRRAGPAGRSRRWGDGGPGRDLRGPELRHGRRLSGWGIPMATDIAFALGVLALLGDRVPPRFASSCWPWRSSTTSARSWSSPSSTHDGFSWAVARAGRRPAGASWRCSCSGCAAPSRTSWSAGSIWAAVFTSGSPRHPRRGGAGADDPDPPAGSASSTSRGPPPSSASGSSGRWTSGDREHADALLGQFEELDLGTESPLDRLERSFTPGRAT